LLAAGWPARVVLVLLAIVVAGAAVGIAWRFVAPLPQFRVLGGQLASTQTEGETAVAADAWFGMCALVAGAVTAVVVFALVRAARIDVLLGLTLGSLAAAVVAWRVGLVLSPGPLPAHPSALADGTRLEGPLRMSAKGVLFAWPLAAVGVYFALGAGLDRSEPVRAHDQWGPVSPP
jgi:hypothetical protein